MDNTPKESRAVAGAASYRSVSGKAAGKKAPMPFGEKQKEKGFIGTIRRPYGRKPGYRRTPESGV